MFENIKINNFRGIRSAEIDGLKGVNLFWGKNNCGKSTLLDALFIVSGLSNPQLPLTVNFLRDYVGFGEKDLYLNFYNFQTSSPIEFYSKNEHERHLRVSLVSSSKTDITNLDPDSATNLIKREFGYRLDYSYDGLSYYSELIFKSEDGKATMVTDDQYNESLRCKYLPPKFKFMASIEGLKEMFENKDEQFLLDVLRVISPEVVDLQLAEDTVLVDIGKEQRIPINLMGDGIRKLLAIILGIYECRNGVLLIDEIDNGLHYSVVEKVWEAVISFAKYNNTQVFATTHNIDSLKGFNEAVKALDDSGNVSAFKLVQTSEGELKSFKYSPDQLDYAIKQEIEVR